MSEVLEVAVTAAREAGRLLREGWGKPVVITQTSRRDLKLEMDVTCEQAIRRLVRAAFPDHAILAEEGGGELALDRPTWIIDPLDGSVNYARQIPHFCVSIAYHEAERAVVGVVYDPITDELFTAQENQGARLNGAPISVSDIRALDRAIMASGFSSLAGTMDSGVEEFNRIVYASHKVRLMGAAALDMAYVAAGRYDAFWEFGLRTWDVAAGTLLIREGGGRVLLTPTLEHTWDVRADNGRLWE